MSKAKDRARAKLGQIFRDGRLWAREEWERLHPSNSVPTPCHFPVGTREEPMPYYCGKCKRTHRVGTKVYEAHSKLGVEIISIRSSDVPSS